MPHDAIWTLAYNELLISCQHPGCSQHFEPSILEVAADPVEVWATAMADRARTTGWTVNIDNLVECADHAD